MGDDCLPDHGLIDNRNTKMSELQFLPSRSSQFSAFLLSNFKQLNTNSTKVDGLMKSSLDFYF